MILRLGISWRFLALIDLGLVDLACVITSMTQVSHLIDIHRLLIAITFITSEVTASSQLPLHKENSGAAASTSKLLA